MLYGGYRRQVWHANAAHLCRSISGRRQSERIVPDRLASVDRAPRARTSVPGGPCLARGFWIIRWEQRAPRLFVYLALERQVAAHRPCSCDGGARTDGIEETGQIRECGERRVGGQYPRCALQPSPRGHIDDRILVSHDVVAPRQVLLKHAIVPLDFPPVPVDRIGNLLGRGVLEMNRLAGEGAESRADKEQP